MMDQSAPDIYDIRGPLPIEGSSYFWPWVFLAFLVCAAILFWFFYKKKRSAPKIASAYEIALKELESAQDPKLADKSYAGILTSALKQYLEVKLALPVREYTTEEFFEAVHAGELLSSELLKIMQPFLDLCDHVKFAQKSLALEERSELFQSAQALLNDLEATFSKEPSP